MTIKKGMFYTLLCFLALLLFTACSAVYRYINEVEPEETYEENTDNLEYYEPREQMESYVLSEDGKKEWAIYWYLCGSDLESGYGSATADLEEMLCVELPENINVVIQTGGAKEWQNSFVNPNYLERFVYNSEGLKLVDTQPLESMGDPNTLSSFLDFAVENYPAEHTAVIIWNHGGGSVAGVAFDELFEMDSLTLGELYEAFTEVFDPSFEEQPIDLIGFDTCLMATIDTAFTFCDIAQYLVASQEIEPENGWYYSQWLGKLAENPDISGAELGRYICDSYIYGCKKEGTDSYVTLSVTDLGEIGPLLSAYDEMGAEALNCAYGNSAFFAEFSRNALSAENYGGNNNEEGYTNMVDLGHLASNNLSILPNTANKVLAAIENCIIYKVNGAYRSKASGLSCYFSYNGDLYDFRAYQEVGASEAFKYFYNYGLTGELIEGSESYLNDVTQTPDVSASDISALENWPLYVTDDGYAVLDIGADMASMLIGVYFELYYVDFEEDLTVLLGVDNDIYADWDNGVFYDNFRGVWGAIDGHFVYMELSYEGEDYNLYTVPILLNGEEMNLYVAYSFTQQSYEILGARRSISDSGMADKSYILLRPGDVITTVHYVSSISGDDDLMPVEMDEIIVSRNTEFTEQWLGDGEFIMMYEMVDIQSNAVYSDIALFTIEGSDIYIAV